MRSSSSSLFFTSSILRFSSASSSNNSNHTSSSSLLLSSTTTHQLSAKATVDTLSKLLDNGHINAFCSILRDGFYRSEHSSDSLSSSSHENHYSASSNNSTRAEEQQKSSPSSSNKKVLLSPFPAPSGLNSSNSLIESAVPFTNPYQKQMRILLRRSVHDALVQAQKERESTTMKTSEPKSSNKISPASWMVLANVAVSQGMWLRSLEVFDQLAGNNTSNTGKKNNSSSSTIKDFQNLLSSSSSSSSSSSVIEDKNTLLLTKMKELQQQKTQQEELADDDDVSTNSARSSSFFRRLPAPHTIAQTLRPGNINIVRRWCRENNARLDILTGMKVLVEFSDDWAAALRLALEEERQPLNAPRGAVESYSLGVLIPFLASGGQWTTASAVLADALARGSLVSDSLVQMILKSTAEKRTWVSCLALTSSLSSCFAIHPSSSSHHNNHQSSMMAARADAMLGGGISSSSNANINSSSASSISNNNSNVVVNRDLLLTLRAVASVCRTWQQACSMISVCQRAGVKSGDEFIIGSAMEKLQKNGKWMEASRLIQIAVEDGTLFAGTTTTTATLVSDYNNTRSSLHSQQQKQTAETQLHHQKEPEHVSWMSNLNKTNMEVIIARRLIDSFRAECQWSKAIRALSWMSKADSAASAAGLLATVELLATAGQWEAAAEIGSKVFASSSASSSNSSSSFHLLSSPHLTSDNSSSMIISRSEDFYFTLMQALSSAGRWREATQTFTEMVQDSNFVTLPANVEVRSASSNISMKDDDSTHKKETGNNNNNTNDIDQDLSMENNNNNNNNTIINACDSILEACSKDNNNWQAALSFFERALAWEPRILLAVSNYENVVEACLAAARWREASSLIRLQRRNGVELALSQIRTGLWTSAKMAVEEEEDGEEKNTKSSISSEHYHHASSSTISINQQNHQQPIVLPSVAPWIVSLRFYELIPNHRRTAADTEVITNLATSQAAFDRKAATALQRAIFALATTGARNQGGSDMVNNKSKPRKARR